MNYPMRSLLENNKSEMKRLPALFLMLALIAPGLHSQDFPGPMQPPRLVNDFTNLFDRSSAENLERKLLDFNNQTSTQIYVVTVPTLNGYEPNDYTTRLAEKWRVGVKGRDNGVMILIKPKTADSDGDVQIETGYGVEGPVPDLTCHDIIDREILPAFRNGDYYGGLDKATSTLMSLVRGEFSAAGETNCPS